MSDIREEMKKAYVFDGMTYRQIAERFGVKERKVGEYARADLWRELRRRARLGLPPLLSGPSPVGEDNAGCRVSDTATASAALQAEASPLQDEVARLAMRVAQLGADAAADDRQFMRYIVSEKSGRGESETVERVFQKLDTKAYRELTSAIKDLWSIAQDTCGDERGGVAVELGSAAEYAE